MTEWGARLDAIVVSLDRWGADAPELSDDHVGADSAMIKLRSFFSPQPERPWTATDTIVDTDSDTLDRILGESQALTEAINDGRLTITGDNEAGQRLFDAVRI